MNCEKKDENNLRKRVRKKLLEQQAVVQWRNDYPKSLEAQDQALVEAAQHLNGELQLASSEPTEYLELMLKLFNSERGIFYSKHLIYTIYKKKNQYHCILEDIMAEDDAANNPITPYSNAKEEEKCKKNALEQIYSVKAALLARGINTRGEGTATVKYAITQASQAATRVICEQEATFKLYKSTLNGHNIDLKISNDDGSTMPFSLKIRTIFH